MLSVDVVPVYCQPHGVEVLPMLPGFAERERNGYAVMKSTFN